MGQTLSLIVSPALEARVASMVPHRSGKILQDLMALLVLEEQRVQAMQATKLLEQDVYNAFRRRAYG